jgi:PAS domain S-box-containing protein
MRCIMVKLYQKMFEESSLPAIIIDSSDTSAHLSAANKAFCKLFPGFAPDPGNELEQSFGEADIRIAARIKAALQAGKKNIRIVIPGRELTLEWQFTALQGTQYLAECSNVSQEVQELQLELMHLALEKSRSSYHLLLGEMHNIFICLKKSGADPGFDSFSCADVNAAFEQVCGPARDELLGQQMHSHPFFSAEGIKETACSVFASGQRKVSSFRNELLGKSFDISIYKFDENHVALLATDITARETAQAELKASEERYRKLLETAVDRIAVFDLGLNLKYANQSFYQQLGFDKETYPNNCDGILSLCESPGEIQDLLAEARQKGKAQIMYRVRHRSGRLLDMQASVQVLDPYGTNPEILMISRDITAMKEHETELTVAKEKAEESEKLKSSFLANMSHEIRTPLNGILGFSKLLARPNLSAEKAQHYINLIDSNGSHLLSIISDILDIAKIESKQLRLHITHININELFDGLLEISNSIVLRKDLRKISISVSKGMPSSEAWIETDQIRLTQIMRNLLENALKFTPEGAVNFGYKLAENGLYCYVRDTGIGISNEKLNVIFQHFRQEDDSITRRFGGTGLGLSICSNLVKMLGGEIGVESEKGQGTLFYFTLPCKPKALPKKAAAEISN